MSTDLDRCYVDFIVNNKSKDISLSDGIAGQLLFLAQSYLSETDRNQKNTLEKIALNKIINNEFQVDSQISTMGLWTGPLGLSAAIDIWETISTTQKDIWENINLSCYQVIEPLIRYWSTLPVEKMDKKYYNDWIFGLAGVINYICNCTIAYRYEIKNKLFKDVVSTLNCNDYRLRFSFSHGNLGIRRAKETYFQKILGMHLPRYCLDDIVDSYIQYLNIDFNKKYENLLIEGYTKYNLPLSWCNGVLGMLPFISDNKRHLLFSTCFEKINIGVVDKHSDKNYFCICHGLESLNLLSYLLDCESIDFLDKYEVSNEPDYSFLSGIGGTLTIHKALRHKKKFVADWLFGL